jgi:tRNA-splicing ligase RtcB
MSSSIPEAASYEARAVTPWVREIPADAEPHMRVPARIFADEALWHQIAADKSLQQLVNTAALPGVSRCVYAMPDVHEGYGFPVGGVAAMRLSDGVISPGGVGYDINCGVRLLASELDARAAGPRIEPVVHDLSRSIPAGPGRQRQIAFSETELDDVLRFGAKCLLERGIATVEDLAATESGGHLADADPGQVSAKARARAHGQLGTIGSGNHFVEVQRVDAIFDLAAAEAFGLRKDRITVLIHTGSRGLGHQVCTEFVRQMDAVMARFGIVVPDRQLACAPFRSPEGEAYFGAMCAAANFAWANRQTITHAARNVFRRAFGETGALRLVYDVAHNMAKVERYDGEDLCVHRKGATRAFGPSNPEMPPAYRGVGQPVLIPGSMGAASWVLAGNDAAAALSFASTCHGAGRALSRGAAKRLRSGSEVRRDLERRGIVVRCPSSSELAEEAPEAYKDVERVVEVVHRAGLARKVARLTPLGVVKG